MDTEPRHAICVDFGSTYTKAVLVSLSQGRLLGLADHPTTIATDVLEGYQACRETLLAQHPEAASAKVFACSSAGGGLRIAVMGNEDLVTAEAGRRVALSSGGKVVALWALSLGLPNADEVAAAAADVVLLTGGTDGGNRDAIVQCAEGLVDAGWQGPVVVAGNVEAQPEVAVVLTKAGLPAVYADNVVPRIGVLVPDSARAAVREMFLSHVIGGKHLSASDEFLSMVRGPTPDLVLTAVELLSRGLDAQSPGVGDVVVVDVGGATTDVHSVVEVDPEDAGLAREVVATTPVSRTVEGDLGMRWSAVTTVAAAGIEDERLVEAAARRQREVGFVPTDPADLDDDEAIAAAAIGQALRRHAGRSKVVVSPEGRVVERTGKDLREVDLLVGSGGVLRHGRPGAAERVFADSVGYDLEGGWQLPEDPVVVVDSDYVLAAAGLLSAEHPEAAYQLVRSLR